MSMRCVADAMATDGLEILGERQNGDLLVRRLRAPDRLPPRCKRCGSTMIRHGRRVHHFADEPTKGQPVRLEISKPRFRCSECRSTTSLALRSMDDRHRATRRLVRRIRRQVQSRSLRQIAAETGMAVNTIRAIANSVVNSTKTAIEDLPADETRAAKM